MSTWSIFISSCALVFGSFLGAALLTVFAVWLADLCLRRWAAPLFLCITVGTMLVSPLGDSLFVRMLALFGIVGAGLSFWVNRNDISEQGPR